MGKLPAFQFYPADWLKDPNLRRCSHAAKGVWIDMLCLMHECEERGVLATAGKAWSDEEIASVIGGDREATLNSVRELVEKQVARRRGAGAIYSARMTRDEAIRKARAAAGSEGGKQKASKAPSKTLAKGLAKPGSSSSSSSSSSTSVKNPPTPLAERDECPHDIPAEGTGTNPSPLEEVMQRLLGQSRANFKSRNKEQIANLLREKHDVESLITIMEDCVRDGVKWDEFIKRAWGIGKKDKPEDVTQVKAAKGKYDRFR